MKAGTRRLFHSYLQTSETKKAGSVSTAQNVSDFIQISSFAFRYDYEPHARHIY